MASRRSQHSNDLNRIEMALERLCRNDYITKTTDPPHRVLNSTAFHGVTNEKITYDLNNTNIQVGLTPEGYSYITDELRKEKQEEINETIKDNSVAQKNTAIAVACFTLITMLVSVATFWSTCGKPQQNLLQVPPHILLKLDSTLQVQRGINSSLRKAVKNSFYQKHH